MLSSNNHKIPRAIWLQRLLARTAIPLSLVTPLAVVLLWVYYSPWLALVTLLCGHFPFLYGALPPNRRLFGPVTTSFIPNGNEVWLTIDDGPHPIDTPLLLNRLDATSARATFFVRGDRARAHPRLIAEILRRGHSLGNHTYNHPQTSFWRLPARRVEREIEDCQQVLRELTGQAARYFRAPVGMINPGVHQATEAREMRVVGWSARGLDGATAPVEPDEVVKRILQDLRPGGIVLLHEGRSGATANDRPNVRTLEMLLDALAERGWRAIVPEDAKLR